MSDLSPLPRGVAGLMDSKWSLDRPLTGVRGATLRCLHCMCVLGSSTWVPLMGFWIQDLWCHRHGGEVDTHESGRSPSSVTVTVVVPDILTSR
ncbi:hypothetical protein GE21DRAFT_1278883 [Neurospora crassa]|nr:hypothetical protein GE21DRAFT_1278883 [Neurospora crassa]